MNQELIAACGLELYQAMQTRQVLRPLTERYADISIDDAYHISLALLQHRLDAGERVVGKTCVNPFNQAVAETSLS